MRALVAAVAATSALVALFSFAGPAVGAPLDGRAVAASADCAACHLTPQVTPPARTANCTVCHQWVRSVAANPTARAEAMAIFPNWARYETSVQSYFAVPDLSATFARVRASWL